MRMQKQNMQKYADFVIHMQNMQNMRPQLGDELEMTIYIYIYIYMDISYD